MTRRPAIAALLSSAALLLPAHGWAQDRDAPPPAADPAQSYGEEGGDEIVVTGQLRGAVQGDIPPEVQLSPADVRAYGVPTIGELLTALAPQTGSGQGRGGEQPVVLLSGRRISGFAEIRELPTEAIERVDILPEEVALKYGYRPDQKVVNIVLRRRFRALTTQLEGRIPTAGGNTGTKGSADILKINRDGRLSLDVTYDGNSGILESERDVVRSASGLFDIAGNIAGVNGAEIDPALSAAAGTPVTLAGVPAGAGVAAPTLAGFVPTANRANASDLTPYRTLVAPHQDLTINGVYNRNLSAKVGATLNLRLESESRDTLLGLPGVTLRLPAGSPYSPFANDVLLYRYLDNLAPLSRSSDSQTAHAGLTLNGDGTPWSSNWRWSMTGNYDRVTTQTITDTGVDPVLMQRLLDAGDPAFNPFAAVPTSAIAISPADVANSTSSVGNVDLLVNGALFKLPAGDVSTSIRLGGRTSDLSSDSFRAGVTRDAHVSRDSGSAQANIDLPIASRRNGVLDAIGDLSINANVAVEQLSDFGTLVTTGYGIHWSPIPQVRLIASISDDENAPSANQLGDPVLTTPLVRVFDYVRGESIDVTTITGGNPALRSDSRHVFKLGLNVRPLTETDLSFSANYVSSTIRNQIASFPAATAEIEAAFPDRFVRDTDGTLLRIDNRAVNFDRAERSQLRWGFNLSLPLASTLQKRMEKRREEFAKMREEAERTGQPLPPEATGRQGQGQFRRPGSLFADDRPPQGAGQGGQRGPGGPGGGFGGRGGGGFGGRGGGAMGGRIQLSLYHTWHFKDQVTIRPGVPVLDLLDGSAIGSRGGQPVHELEGNAGISKDGLGARLSGNWQSGTQVAAGVLGSGDRLNFGSLATLNLRLFADLGQQLSLVRRHRWLRATRVTLAVDNLFDAHQRVTDGSGIVPISYQPDLLDPQGRVVRLSIRKLFL